MQHPIPQNIMDVEFKLVGDLTLKQFAYVAVGFGLAYIVFTSPLPIYAKYPLLLLFGALGVLFAFFPLDDRGLDLWFLNYVQAIYKPQRRLWEKQGHLPDALTMDLRMIGGSKERNEEKEREKDTRLSTYLTTHTQNVHNVAEVKENDLMRRINALLNDEMKGNRKLSPIIPLRKEQTPLATVTVEKPPNTFASQLNYNPSTPLIPVKLSAGQTHFKAAITNVTPNRPITILENQGPSLNTRPQFLASSPKPRVFLRPVAKANTAPKPELPEEADARNQVLLTEVKGIINSLKDYNNAGPRPIINLEEFPGTMRVPSQGTLPTQEPAEAPVIPAQTKVNLSQLRQKKAPLEGPILEKAPLRVPQPPLKTLSPAELQVLQMKALEDQNKAIITHLEQAKVTLAQIQTKPQTTLGKNPTPPVLQKEKVESPKPQSRLHTPAPPKETTPVINKEETLTQRLLREKQLSVPAKIRVVPPQNTENLLLTNQPNIINGIVYGKDGELVASAIVLVMDDSNIPKWASKTNSAGQFVMMNPVSNGRYKIEVQKPGLTFDTIELETNGNVMQPIPIEARLK